MKTKFNTIKIDSTTTIQKEGMEISGYIAGVNSGMYGLPYTISIRTWCSKWFFKKFFYREMKLNINEVKLLKEELEKVIQFYNENTDKKDEK